MLVQELYGGNMARIKIEYDFNEDLQRHELTLIDTQEMACKECYLTEGKFTLGQALELLSTWINDGVEGT